MIEIDSQLFDSISDTYYNSQQSDTLKRAKLDQKWRKLELKLKKSYFW
jgi:hypothetical protein